MRVDVAGRHARHAEPPREPRQPPVAGAIVAQERPLQLDPQPVGAERVEQPPQRELVVHAAQRAAAQADEPLGVLEHRLERHVRLRRRAPAVSRVCACARVRIRHRFDQPRASSTSSVRWRPSSRSISAPWIGRSPSARADDRELHRARDRVVVGQRERLVAQLQRRRHQLVGKRRPVEERERRVAVELHVRHRTYVRIAPGRTTPTAIRTLDNLLVDC